FSRHGKEKDLIGKNVIFNSKMGGGGSGIDWGPLPAKPPANADDSWYKTQNNQGIDITAEIIGVADNGTVGDGSNYVNIAWARRLNTQVSWQYPKCDKNQQCQNSNVMTLVKQDNFADQGYTSIILRVDDPANLQNVADQISKLGYGPVTAQAMLDQINKIMTLVGIVLGAIAGISLFVAGIGIINTMMMATLERTKEIGVMRACGATKGVIRSLFTFEAAMLGFWGGIFGLIGSIFLGQIGKFIITKYGASLGSLPVNNIGSFPLWLIAAVIGFTTLIGLFSGLYPAIKASKLNPVDALRYE
ncbi:MAG: FtsX-like permease family protein, partial [Candidatus Berkelbacteria bacterium]